MRFIIEFSKKIFNGDRWISVKNALFRSERSIKEKILRVITTICTTYQSIFFYWGVLSLDVGNKDSIEEMDIYYKILAVHLSTSVWMELWSSWRNTALLIPLTREERKETRIPDEKNVAVEFAPHPILAFDFPIISEPLKEVLGNIRWVKLFTQITATFYSIKFLGKNSDSSTTTSSVLLITTGALNMLSQYIVWRKREAVRDLRINEGWLKKIFVWFIPALCASIIYWKASRNFAGTFTDFLSISKKDSTAYGIDMLWEGFHALLFLALINYKYKMSQDNYRGFVQQSEENEGKCLDVWALLGAGMHGIFRGGLIYVVWKQWFPHHPSMAKIIGCGALTTSVGFFSAFNIYFNHVDVETPPLLNHDELMNALSDDSEEEEEENKDEHNEENKENEENKNENNEENKENDDGEGLLPVWMHYA